MTDPTGKYEREEGSLIEFVGGPMSGERICLDSVSEEINVPAPLNPMDAFCGPNVRDPRLPAFRTAYYEVTGHGIATWRGYRAD